MSAVADKYQELQDLGVEVFSVSVDSHFVHKMWNDHELTKMVDGGIPFHMLSDQAGNIGKAYGVYDEAQGIELRGRSSDIPTRNVTTIIARCCPRWIPRLTR